MSTPPSPRSSARRSGRRRGAITAAVLTAGLSTALVAGFPVPAAATISQTGSCVDGGGVRWQTKAVWGGPYTARDGVRRVSMDYAGWTTDRRGEVPTDSRVRVYDDAGRLHQELSWTGSFDYESGTEWRVRNARNPASAPGQVQLRITLGVDGDGRGDCTVTFTQPGWSSSPTPAPTPTPSPSPTLSPTPTPTAPPPTGSDGDRYEADVVTATNAERTSTGLEALSDADSCVDRFAEQQAARMAAESRMYHQDLSPILSECDLSRVGENVAYGYDSGAEVTEAWMNSAGHRANILNTSYELLGVGAAQNDQGRWYAAQVFGTR